MKIEDIKIAVREEYSNVERHLMRFCDYSKSDVAEVISEIEAILNKLETGISYDEAVRLMGIFGFKHEQALKYTSSVMELVK